VEESQRIRFMRKLAKEEAWIRQGVKARRTRNEGRVRDLMKLRAEQLALRTQTGSVRIQIEEAQRTGKMVIEAEGISHAYGRNPLIDNFSVKIMRATGSASSVPTESAKPLCCASCWAKPCRRRDVSGGGPAWK